MVRGVQSLARMDFFFLSGCVNLRLCSQIFGAFFYFFFEVRFVGGLGCSQSQLLGGFFFL